MKIPSKIKIGGHWYRVEWKRNLYRDHDAAGMSNANKLTIELDPTGEPSHIDEIFWHEIIEQINYRFELNLPHDKISILGTVIHQIITDNPGLLGEGCQVK